MCMSTPKMPPPPKPPPSAPPPPEKPPEALEDAVDSTATSLKKNKLGSKSSLGRGNKSGIQVANYKSKNKKSGLSIAS